MHVHPFSMNDTSITGLLKPKQKSTLWYQHRVKWSLMLHSFVQVDSYQDLVGGVIPCFIVSGIAWEHIPV